MEPVGRFRYESPGCASVADSTRSPGGPHNDIATWAKPHAADAHVSCAEISGGGGGGGELAVLGAMTSVVFPGTDQERDALLVAIGHACMCGSAGLEPPARRCQAHSLLLDTRILKHLIFYRRWHRALQSGEWCDPAAWR
jgi:hypothetical protein